MRITSGLFKGYPLVYPKTKSFRPTQEKVRSAVFDSIRNELNGAHFLDLCCGTGAIGFEALSRGANHITLVDIDIHFAGRNRDALLARVPDSDREGISKKITLIRSNVRDYARRWRTHFDVVFVDPPWDRDDIYRDVVDLVDGSDMLRPDGILVCEHRCRRPVPIPETLSLVSHYSYGQTEISIISRKESV
ncbi:hypothetical protein EB093_02575 [bacterium]|nr:hypothetical protein [bacterium]